MLCFKVLAIVGIIRLAKNSSISLAFSIDENCGRSKAVSFRPYLTTVFPIKGTVWATDTNFLKSPVSVQVQLTILRVWVTTE